MSRAFAGRRKLARGAAALALCGTLALGCKPPFNVFVALAQLSATICALQLATFYKIPLSGVPIQLGSFSNPSCNLGNSSLSGDLAGTFFTADAYVDHASDGDLRWAALGVNIDFSGVPSLPLRAQQEATFSASYGATQGGGIVELIIKAAPVNLGGTGQEPVTGFVDVSVDGIHASQVVADGQFSTFPLNPAGGTIDFTATAEIERRTAGSAYQGVAIEYGIRRNMCESDHQCLLAGLPGHCTALGCFGAQVGDPCDHDSDCAFRCFCSSRNVCSDGSPGSSCNPGEADCAGGICNAAMTCGPAL